MNLLCYGDNLDVLRRYIQDETVDLIYLDPPFKSNQDYNILLASRTALGLDQGQEVRILGSASV